MVVQLQTNWKTNLRPIVFFCVRYPRLRSLRFRSATGPQRMGGIECNSDPMSKQLDRISLFKQFAAAMGVGSGAVKLSCP